MVSNASNSSNASPTEFITVKRNNDRLNEAKNSFNSTKMISCFKCKGNHHIKNCDKVVCPICKENHFIKTCPQYDPHLF